MKFLETILKRCFQDNVVVYDKDNPDYITEKLCNLAYSTYRNISKKTSKIIKAYLEDERAILFRYNGEKIINIDYEIIPNITEVYLKLDGCLPYFGFDKNPKIVIFEMENGDMILGSY